MANSQGEQHRMASQENLQLTEPCPPQASAVPASAPPVLEFKCWRARERGNRTLSPDHADRAPLVRSAPRHLSPQFFGVPNPSLSFHQQERFYRFFKALRDILLCSGRKTLQCLINLLALIPRKP